MKTFVKKILTGLISSDSLLRHHGPAPLLRFLERLSTPPAGDRYYGERASSYDAVRSRQDWWHSEKRGVEAALRDLPDVSSVLDVPSGTGRFFDLYQAHGLVVNGLDASSDMLAQARLVADKLELKVSLTEGDARRLPFEDGAFDLVVCFRFLQSIVVLSDARTVIREIARVTRSFALLELDFDDDQSVRKVTPSEKATMRNRLDRNQVETLLIECGLKVSRTYGPFRELEKSQYGFLCEKI